MNGMRNLLFLISTCFLAGEAKAQSGSVRIDTFGFISPAVVNDPGNPDFLRNSLMAMAAGATSMGTIGTSSYWEALVGPNFSVRSSDFVFTPDFNSWRGQVVSGGPYGLQHGSKLSFGFFAQSDTMFSLSNITFTLTTPYAYFEGAGESFTTVSMGIIRGVNGQPDTTVFFPDSSQKFDAIASIGISHRLVIRHSPGISDQYAIDEQLDSDADTYGSPFQIAASYNLQGSGKIMSVDIIGVNFVRPLLTGVSAANGTFRFRLEGIAGHRYQIQYAGAVTGPWTNSGSPFLVGTNGSSLITDTNLPSTRFYRSITVP